ncbi:MAG: anti-sigma factor [Chloroflexota bacterium]|nr:MAG: anti-sigma factor [Chloroflexota bacterium]
MSPQEHYFDLLPAYALGSLDEEEQLQVSQHLATCEVCRAELHNFDQIVDDLPLAIAQSEPAGEVKDKIMAYARGEKDSVERISEQTWWERLTQGMRASAPVWGIASLILIVILGLSNLFLWGRLNEIERVSQNVLISIPLQGTDATPQAVGMVVVSQDGEHGTLVVDGLPSLDEMSQYQLWLIRDEQRTNGGVFSVDEEGYGNLWVSSPEPLLSYSAFGITVEPAGGSPGPTGVKVLGGEL